MGQVFKAARERKRISLSTAAARTRIKIQHLEAMERDDFSKMPAPAYARGFIRMYAEFLGLDAGPLIEEYTRLHDPTVRGRVTGKGKRQVASPPSPVAEERAPAESGSKGEVSHPRRIAWRIALPRLSASQWKRIGLAVAGLVLVVWVAAGVRRCARETTAQPSPFQFRRAPPAIAEEPPEPYLPIPEIPGGQP